MVTANLDPQLWFGTAAFALAAAWLLWQGVK